MNERTPDNILVSEYQRGNEDALSILIEKYQKELFSFIFFKVMDRDLANDFFQDTFMKIIVHLKTGRYIEEGKFVLWAKRIAQNLIIDYFRIQSKRIKISETSYKDEDISIFDEIREPAQNIEDQMVMTQIFENLHSLLVNLPDNQQEIIKLRFFDGLSFNEIAEQTNSSINTCLGRVRYALINLRKQIEGYDSFLTR